MGKEYVDMSSSVRGDMRLACSLWELGTGERFERGQGATLAPGVRRGLCTCQQQILSLQGY